MDDSASDTFQSDERLNRNSQTKGPKRDERYSVLVIFILAPALTAGSGREKNDVTRRAGGAARAEGEIKNRAHKE
ncbi:hypothetical protein EVAR_93178_1 [Eumeta japonica]|uniref:Uncharacterized protein n=1 Tax=Eumeta variegata TaxID=151549 RepID=A0A4C1TFI1_EUMVA|nr:hypothetical protein EVAR_93178_1 [Eumeta japonica]